MSKASLFAVFTLAAFTADLPKAPLMPAELPAQIEVLQPGVKLTLLGKANAEAGRRIFFHPKLAFCATCHRHSGRDNVVVPDLSLIARRGDLKTTLQSILESCWPFSAAVIFNPLHAD